MDSYKPCSIHGCDKKAQARSFCHKHYKRWQTHGDPLGGIAYGQTKKFLSEAVASETDECIIWPFAINSSGYGHIRDGGKVKNAHRLVCEAVHGAPPTPKHEAAHDNNGSPCVSRACVNPRHLRWATLKENQADRVPHGTHNRGENCWRAKITENQVREIRSLRGKMKAIDVAKIFGISENTVSGIQLGRRWGWLE